MKVHYINILLFAHPLNILLTSSQVYNQKNPYFTPHNPNPKSVKTCRSLCECELYAPQNYNNDPEMKEVMENFNKQTEQRFHEYDERTIKKRQKCKDQCDKDIQKIILKDKIEKELTEKLAVLHTDITTNDIPTCVCEKSVADKVEKTCLKCGGILGTALPELGLIGGTVLYAINQWSITATAAAIKFAQQAGIAAGTKAGEIAGIAKTIELVNSVFDISSIVGKELGSIFNAKNYADEALITQSVYSEFEATCLTSASEDSSLLCFFGRSGLVAGKSVSAREVIGASVKKIVKEATNAAAEANATESTKVTSTITAEKTGAIDAVCSSYTTAIIASVVAILVIVLIMVIIYLILRYRRKKKMKKKLQYIKLLKE
ncbi:hypothetical protein PFMALIP_00768 [Plasmodium falciparum MaliPS096_E11]|uniref:Surface antigen n=1 Tax=Plasmodium falciparum MaliPS096_E11 TaxID=1036727 RepID=A0A024WXD1_PLAFA|nr:hypothetical protein PFMALIP_00768 [Plasmodium falciparum MaliPS096_E11]